MSYVVHDVEFFLQQLLSPPVDVRDGHTVFMHVCVCVNNFAEVGQTFLHISPVIFNISSIFFHSKKVMIIENTSDSEVTSYSGRST